MMASWSDKGQSSKKKVVSYGKASARSRIQPASVSTSPHIHSELSQTSAKAPVKDIYDFDFVDDDPPPVVKPAARKRPTPATRESTRPPATSKTIALPGSATPAAKRATGVQSSAAVRPAAGPARGIKRKPSQIVSVDIQQPGAASRVNTADHAGHANGTQRTKSLQSTPSPDPVAIAPSQSISRASKALVKSVISGAPSSSAFPARQRALKTPPIDSAKLRAFTGTQAQAPSPSTVGATATTVRQHQIGQPSSGMPIRPQGSQASSQPRPPQLQSTTAAPRPRHTQPPTQRKRRRLIDTLAAQKESEPESESESDGEDTDSEDVDVSNEEEAISQAGTHTTRHPHERSPPISEGRATTFMDVDSLVTTSPSRRIVAPSTPGTIARRPAARRPNIKFTYNVERTMLAEQPPSLDGPAGSDLSLLQSLLPEPGPKGSAFDFDDDAASASQGAIQSIHELRQAGANSRFADELVDTMDRIGAPSNGKPLSTRRSALMELAEKLQDKSFMRHFRDHGSETQLFREVGKETDVVAGFVLGCIVITLLTNGTVSNRLLRDLRCQKIDSLFGLLLRSDEDIVKLAKDRKSNVSVFSRQVLGSLKEKMRKLPIWKPVPTAPSDVSPRTISLLGLHLFVQQLHGGGGGFGENDTILSASLTRQLFAMVASTLPSAYDGVDGDGDELPVLSLGLSGDAEAVDLYLSLSLLERHSVAAMQLDIGAEWTRHYIPIIAEALEVTLKAHHEHDCQLNGLELLTLKLAMNTANNNPEVARHYVDKGHLRKLAEQSSGALSAITRCVRTGSDVIPGALDELLLMLGVMINFSENDDSAAESLVEGGGSVLIERLGQAFLDGRSIAAEADSEEKTQINVAFAYLSILLGYLCRYDPVYKAFRKLSPSGSPKPLLDSIHQFIEFHDRMGKTGDPDYGAEASHFTARLQALALELEARSY